MLILAFVAGAAQVVSPDHWMPLSMMGWQKRWGGLRVSMTAIVLYFLHLGAGVLLFYALSPLLQIWDGSMMFQASVALVLMSLLYRVSRLDRVDNVLHQNLKRRYTFFELWGVETVVGFLGPCETLLPIMIKAHNRGEEYLPVLVAFAGGTIIVGLLLITFTRDLWHNPARLTRGVLWANENRALMPALAGLGLGLIFLSRL